jgi:hypothetical protein
VHVVDRFALDQPAHPVDELFAVDLDVDPPKPIQHMAEKYTAVPVEYKPHFPGVPGWEEVADYALAWARR